MITKRNNEMILQKMYILHHETKFTDHYHHLSYNPIVMKQLFTSWNNLFHSERSIHQYKLQWSFLQYQFWKITTLISPTKCNKTKMTNEMVYWTIFSVFHIVSHILQKHHPKLGFCCKNTTNSPWKIRVIKNVFQMGKPVWKRIPF